MKLGLQGWIHAFEEGAGARWIKILTGVLAFFTLALVYNYRSYQNLWLPDAMDNAQVARNVAEGRGFTTDFIRPLSVHLLQKKAGGTNAVTGVHPDLANAPMYPLVLGEYLKRVSPDYAIDRSAPFNRYQPDLRIAYLNQGLFFLCVAVLFSIARRLFDDLVAWLSVFAVAGSELFWRYSISGLSTHLAILLLLALVGCLVWAERGAREDKWGLGRLLPLALLAGVLTGLLGLTRYSLAVLIFPVLAYFIFAFEQRKAILAIAALVAFAGVTAPWINRNLEISGTPFGTAGYALYAESDIFPGNSIERSLKPNNIDVPQDLGKYDMSTHGRKFLVNFARMVREDLPRLGGSWVGAFFLAGLLVPFNRPGLSRLRIFLLMSLGLLVIAQALGKSHLSANSPDVSSENLLIIAAPIVFMFGAGMFSVLLDQTKILPFLPGRGLLTGFFFLLFSAPLLCTLLTPRYTASAYPPYHPPIIQESASWMRPGEVTMSDIPWAVAWYGKRPAVWLTSDPKDSFKSLAQIQPIRALYLTPLTMDGKLVSEMLDGEQFPWNKLAIEAVVNGELPDGFPLTHALTDWFPDQLFLSDRDRWSAK